MTTTLEGPFHVRLTSEALVHADAVGAGEHFLRFEYTLPEAE